MERVGWLEFAGADSGTFPGTWAQREFWNTINTHQPHGRYQFPWWMRVGPGHTIESVRLCLSSVVARHQALRTTLQRDAGGALIQTIHDEGRIPLWQVEVPPHVNPLEANASLRELLWDSLDVREHFALRAVVITSHGAPTILLCLCSHMLLDGKSSEILGREITATLNGTGSPQGPEDGSPVRPSDLARWEGLPSSRRLSERSLAHWKRVIQSAPASIFPPATPRGKSPIWRGYLHSPAIVAAEVVLMRRTGLSSSALFLTASACILSMMADVERMMFRVGCSNRIERSLRNFVGCLAQSAAVLVDLSAETFDDLARLVSDDLLKGYAFARYDGDGLYDLIRDVTECAAPPDLTLVFNDNRWRRPLTDGNVSGADLDQALKSRRESHISWELPNRYNSDVSFFVRLSRLSDETVLDVAADVSCFSKEEIEHFLLAMERLLVYAAKRNFPLTQMARIAGGRPVAANRRYGQDGEHTPGGVRVDL